MSLSTATKSLACSASLVAGCLLPSFSQTPKKQTAAPSQGDTITGHYKEKLSEDTVDVKLLPGNKIKLHLFAYYPCANPSLKDRPGGPNTGETEATIPIKNGVAVYTTSEYGGKCKITFKFIGKKVIVEQEESDIACCGYGMNVNASGTYVKLSSRPDF
jgi:hypothetical protein